MSGTDRISRAVLTRHFFVATVMQAVVAFCIAFLLSRLNPVPPPGDGLQLPTAFQFGTLFLLAGSWFLHRSVQHVKIERQVPFRRSLLLALACAILFVGVQSFGLWHFASATKDVENPQMNVHGFVFMFTALHAMHFLVAQSVLLWITLSAFADRYDHEYYWGVTFASCFWHVLGIVWLGILCVFAIAVQ
ncbi:MAG: hypothetical protein R3C19_16580 [Planctomycetaceae bacterium]